MRMSTLSLPVYCWALRLFFSLNPSVEAGSDQREDCQDHKSRGQGSLEEDEIIIVRESTGRPRKFASIRDPG